MKRQVIAAWISRESAAVQFPVPDQGRGVLILCLLSALSLMTMPVNAEDPPAELSRQELLQPVPPVEPGSPGSAATFPGGSAIKSPDLSGERATERSRSAVAGVSTTGSDFNGITTGTSAVRTPGHVRIADAALPAPDARFPVPPVPGATTALADAGEEPLPPLEEELRLHGGSFLYEPEGDYFDPTAVPGTHSQTLRLPESWQKPTPLTGYAEFQGADPIKPWPGLQWNGTEGFQWEPRLVGYGSYELFGLALEQGGTRQDAVGHQLLVDLDLRLTGTERAHLQFRPLGRRNTGGSFFRLDDPTQYDDNSTLIPDRWWIEGEFYSLFGGIVDDAFTPLDYHITAGKVPYAVHNFLLINDDVTGVIVNKNTLIIPPLSNLNVQAFYFFDDVDTMTPRSTELVGFHTSADWRHAFIESTFAYVSHEAGAGFDSRYAALSVTQFFGPVTLTGRALFKDGDDAGRGDGSLFVFESNLTRAFSHEIQCATGIDYGVFYANAFRATSGWNPISGANFNRLRSSFAVDPLIRIGQGINPSDTTGVSLGAQFFFDSEDQSLTPELAWEAPQGETVWGVGLRWQKKIGTQTYLDASGVVNWSDTRAFDREGILVSTFIVF